MGQRPLQHIHLLEGPPRVYSGRNDSRCARLGKRRHGDGPSSDRQVSGLVKTMRSGNDFRIIALSPFKEGGVDAEVVYVRMSVEAVEG